MRGGGTLRCVRLWQKSSVTGQLSETLVLPEFRVSQKFRANFCDTLAGRVTVDAAPSTWRGADDGSALLLFDLVWSRMEFRATVLRAAFLRPVVRHGLTFATPFVGETFPLDALLYEVVESRFGTSQ